MKPAILAVFWVAWLQAQQGQRWALVIGNQAYRDPSERLCSAAKDARDMASRLQRLGFHVEELHDLDLSGIQGALDRLRNRVAANRDVALLYYAGHGIEAQNENYLLPVDYTAVSEEHVREFAYPAARALNLLETRAATTIVILDACRNTGYHQWRTSTGGLVSLQGAGNSLVAFAASPGQTAAETCKPGENGLFTKSLLNWLEKPGLDENMLLSGVRADVFNESRQRQRPLIVSGLVKPFVFNQAGPQIQPSVERTLGLEKSACKPDPDNPPTERGLASAAECNITLGRFGKAVDQAAGALAKNGRAAGYWDTRGRAYWGDGDPDRALTDFQKAVELDPTNAKYLFDLGRLQFERGEYADALDRLKAAYEAAPDLPGLCVKLADAYEKAGNRRISDQMRGACRQ